MIYEKRLVAFLDVLGFKALVKHQDGQENIRKYLNSINNVVLEKQWDWIVDVIAISDSIILSTPISVMEDNNWLIGDFCDLVAEIQFEMALQNIWLRGAITFGDCYFMKDPIQIIGPAYIKAYELEQSKAIYPRVIIDPDLVSELDFENGDEFINKIDEKFGHPENLLSKKSFSSNLNLKSKDDEKEILNFKIKYKDVLTKLNPNLDIEALFENLSNELSYSKIDDEDFIFVNYLEYLKYKNKDNQIRKNIEENLNNEKLIPSVRSKYQWLQEYLNSIKAVR